MAKYRLREARPKAPFGAAVALGSTLLQAGSQLWGAHKEDRAQREQIANQQRMFINNQNAQNLQNTAMTLNNYFNTLKPYDPYVTYKYGGKVRRRFSSGGKLQVTDGGYILPVGNGSYYVAGGYDHDQINEKGRTGVGMKYGGLTFEVEPGELVKTGKKKAIVLSPKVGNVVGGLDPVQGVLAGYSPRDMYKAQEAKKAVYGIGDMYGNRFKAPFGAGWYNRNNIWRNFDDPPTTFRGHPVTNGVVDYGDEYAAQPVVTGNANKRPLPSLGVESTPQATSQSISLAGRQHAQRSGRWLTDRNKDTSRDAEWFGAYMKPVDWANFGIQATLPFFSYYTNRSNANGIRDLLANAEKSMFGGYGYTPFGFTGLDTKVDYANAERQRIKNNFYDTLRESRRNMASSVDYLNRSNELATAESEAQAKETDKERALNQEYRNKDAELRAQTAAQNAATRASYDQAKLQAHLDLTKQRTDFERSNIRTNEGLIQALGDSVNNLFQTGMDRLSDYHNMALAYGLYPNNEMKEEFLKDNPWFADVLRRGRMRRLRNTSGV